MKARSVATIIVLLWASTSDAQPHWQVVHHFDFEAKPYFINEDYGFVFPDEGGPGAQMLNNASLFRTTDAGKTWRQMNIGPITGIIFSLWFVTPSHGYMGVCEDDFFNVTYDKDGVWETVDSGVTWRRISPDFWSARNVIGIDDTVIANEVRKRIDKVTPTTFLGVMRSTDNGLTWAQTKGLYAQWIANNSDGVVATVGGGYAPFTGAYSTDQGRSWRYNQYPPTGEFHSCFMLPHSPYLFLSNELGDGANGSKAGSIWRSTDNGNTIEEVYHPYPLGLCGSVDGNNCIVYVQHSNDDPTNVGSLRSTDYGLTWKEVGGPNNGNDSRAISVVGRGAVVYASDIVPVALGGGVDLWRTTDGGDGLLSSSIKPQLTVSHFSTSGDSLITQLCDSTSAFIVARFLGCDRIWIDSARIDGTGQNIYYNVLHNRWLGTGQPFDTSQIVFIPKQTGTYPLTVHARLRREDWLIEDTTFHLTLIVKPNPSTLSLTTNALDFGSQSLCHPMSMRDSFSVSAHGCEAMQVDSIIFHPDDPTFKDFSFKTVKSFVAKANDTTFFISFKPTQALNESGVVLVYSFDGLTHRIDTIRATGAGVADSRSFNISSAGLLVQMCDSVDGSITVHNTTCGYLQVDSVTIPSELTVLPGANGLSPFPLQVPDTQGQILKFRFQPVAAGPTTLPVILHMESVSQGKTVLFDTVIDIAATVERGTPKAQLESTALEFGAVSTCGASVTLPVTLKSIGCDTLMSTVSTLSTPFEITKALANSLPVGSSDSALISFTPSTLGDFWDTVTVTTNGGTFHIPIHGTGVSDRVALGLSSTTLSLPDVVAGCGEDSISVVIQNPGCKAIVIDSLSGFKQPFSTSFQGADTIAKNGSGSIELYYQPVNSGSDQTTMKVWYHGDDNVAHDSTITVSAKSVAPPTLTVSMNPGSLTGRNQSEFVMPVYAVLKGNSPSITAIGVNTLSMRVNVRTDLLTPVAITSKITGATASIGNVDGSGANLTIDLPSNWNAMLDTELLQVRFRTYLTDTMTTNITLSDIRASAPTACFTLDSSKSAVTFDYSKVCGDATISHAIGKTSFEIDKITPNPARDILVVGYRVSDIAARVNMEMYDLLGRAVLSEDFDPPESNIGSAELQVGALPSGIYYLRVAAGGFSASRRVVVAK